MEQNKLKSLGTNLYQIISIMLQVQTISHLVYIELLYIYKTNHSVKTENVADVRIRRKTKTSATVRARVVFPWGIAKLTLHRI